MRKLDARDFTTFFSEVWDGFEPFVWQNELAEQVIEQRRWPDLVDIPTGLGKTVTIDIALFALAVEASTEADRTCWQFPHRIVMVVDRRVIVDQAFDRARALCHRILNADPVASPVTVAVREALRARAGIEHDDTDGTPPILTSVLRGGITRDETWARRPEVPAVLASTVDQVGSRLLFRGYGLSTGARPIHAGLLANDTLFLLDEVHLARPFAQTLDAIDDLSRRGDVDALPHRLGVVQLSATPGTIVDERFPPEPLPRPVIDPDSLPSGAASIALRRTGNTKPAELITVKVPGDAAKANEVFAKAAAREAIARLEGMTRVAVMVNRVDTARRIARILRDAAKKHSDFDVVLLTGRMRPADRDAVLRDDIAGRLIPGPRADDEAPLIVVATQSLEAGADFDFDVLVTECASIDALRQRFGRVDRDGQRWLAGNVTPSAVLCRSTDVDAKVTDPVYGKAIAATWAWLESRDHVDFAYRAMPDPVEAELRSMLPPVEQAPLLSASHLDRWNRTSEPQVAAEPEVAQWLHGVAATNQLADVQVVWRDGIDPVLFHWDPNADDVDWDLVRSYERELEETLGWMPPLATETLAVPVREVRRWLSENTGDPLLSDAPSSDAAEPHRSVPRLRSRRVGRWTHDGVTMIFPSDVRPGDTIIVPAVAGGIVAGNWDPTELQPVTDLSRDLSLNTRGLANLLLTPRECEGAALPWPDPRELELVSAAERRTLLTELVDRHRDVLRLGQAPLKGWRVRPLLTGVDRDGEAHLDYLVTASIDRSAMPGPGMGAEGLATDTTDDALSMIGRPMRLDAHLRGVGFHAARFARSLGLEPMLVETLMLAGELHDVGKADSRFQKLLAGGRPTTTLLAKSGDTQGDLASRRAIKREAGYPGGMRHELLSLALIDELDRFEGLDADLVRHLVATHHGWGRYRYRPVFDPFPETVTLKVRTHYAGPLDLSADSNHRLEGLGSGHSERFTRLTRRYGWWRLAYLEAILRLADHYRSALEQAGNVEAEAIVEEWS